MSEEGIGLALLILPIMNIFLWIPFNMWKIIVNIGNPVLGWAVFSFIWAILTLLFPVLIWLWVVNFVVLFVGLVLYMSVKKVGVEE